MWHMRQQLKQCLFKKTLIWQDMVTLVITKMMKLYSNQRAVCSLNNKIAELFRWNSNVCTPSIRDETHDEI